MDTRALIRLWNLTQEHPGTSGARAAAGVLLGLYNGRRFPCDLTDLRLLDDLDLQAALRVIGADAARCEVEVHTWLNRLSGRKDFGARFERLAHDFECFKRGRVRLADLQAVSPQTILVTDTAGGQ